MMQVLRLFSFSDEEARIIVSKALARYLSTFRSRRASLVLMGSKLRSRGFWFIRTQGDTRRLGELIQEIRYFEDTWGRTWKLLGIRRNPKYSVAFFEVVGCR